MCLSAVLSEALNEYLIGLVSLYLFLSYFGGTKKQPACSGPSAHHVPIL